MDRSADQGRNWGIPLQSEREALADEAVRNHKRGSKMSKTRAQQVWDHVNKQPERMLKKRAVRDAFIAFISEKKARNDENIQQVIDVLTAANYRAGRTILSGQSHIEFWVGPGRIPVIAVQYYANDDGFEVYVPITQSNRMDETLYQLRDATNIQPPHDGGAQ
jgi:hypothetical protein